MNDKRASDTHVGAMLSGYIDGELTQQDSQRVRLHCEQCEQCSNELDRLSDLRAVMGRARLCDLTNDKWRETMNDTTGKATRGIGWMLFIGGILLAIGVAIVEIVTGPALSTTEKLIVGGVYGGLLLLFISVLRQRLIERRTDKYKDVEI